MLTDFDTTIGNPDLRSNKIVLEGSEFGSGPTYFDASGQSSGHQVLELTKDFGASPGYVVWSIGGNFTQYHDPTGAQVDGQRLLMWTMVLVLLLTIK